MDKLIESTTPGMTWALSVYRGNRGIVATATEGVVERRGDGSMLSFSTVLLQDRHVRMDVDSKRLTDKVKATNLAALTAKLVADGMAVAP